MSAYIDSMFGGSIANWEKANFGMDVKFLSDYPDFLSFIIMIVFSGMSHIYQIRYI